MDILDIIKKRASIRKYQDKPIPKKILDKIIEAGIWGPSVINIQPWKFAIIRKRTLINKIYEIVIKKAKALDVGGRTVLLATTTALEKANLLILVYNSGEFIKFTKKFGNIYSRLSRISEISAISAAIQNMILIAQRLGIGSCWLDTPLLCHKEINKIVNINDELIAILSLGYPAERGRRSPRKPFSEIVQYIK